MPRRTFCFTGAAFLFTTLLFATAAPVPTDKLEPDGAPSRLTDGPGVPEPIVWPAPPLAKGPFRIESAEERNLRVVVVARGLEQPWSLAFLPDGTLLITERPGRLRVVRHGVLDPEPVAGLPDIKAHVGLGALQSRRGAGHAGASEDSDVHAVERT